MPTPVLLLVNRDKPEAVEAADEVAELVRRHGELVGEAPIDEEQLPREAGRAQVIVVLGGDGSILGEVRRCASMNVAMLGVNLGRLGFMAEFDLPSLRRDAKAIFGQGRFESRELSMVRAQIVRRDGQAEAAGVALNEVCVSAGPPYRMVMLTLRVDGRPGPTLTGDGLIVCTPTGSTAYNLSAGGPIVAPGVDALCITTIAAHSLGVRPILVPGGSLIEIEVVRANRDLSGQGTTLILDGQVQRPIAAGERIRIEARRPGVKFITNPTNDYWQTLISKLHWAEAPRMRGGQEDGAKARRHEGAEQESE
jgi:NAD+ kinase